MKKSNNPIPKAIHQLQLRVRGALVCFGASNQMTTTRLTPLCVAVLLAFPVLSCDNNLVPTDIGEIAHLLATYRDGEFIYEDDHCFLRPPGTDERFEFGCGVVGVGLSSGVVAADVSDLVLAIFGEITRDRSGGDNGWIIVAVPERSERAAIMAVFPDERTRYGALLFFGGVI